MVRDASTPRSFIRSISVMASALNSRAISRLTAGMERSCCDLALLSSSLLLSRKALCSPLTARWSSESSAVPVDVMLKFSGSPSFCFSSWLP
ncbi:hypothetical protein BCR43DRAFT_488961 [Syncephalastrum racemosum]|uniref:Uncharacterized protein n=1 Tax=Syncephalastrum racemosum TaxID=13706 RepID=A0A1X2H5N1_SYNRA|nr:hypothetical protein BCR43DRAFT_495318 [Syncephalastrum racemosum]ORY99249.1 hypothetical protein BCR43DRAFT_488961 [Syncephalastrum racemosum]